MKRRTTCLTKWMMIAAIAAVPAAAWAGHGGKRAPLASAASGRQKKLDFDGDYVETVNKHPLDSLTELSEADKKRRSIHLYRKRTGFEPETAETIQQMRYN